VPIGSKQFCHQFREDRLQGAAAEADKLYEGLTDLQTIIRLFKTCTLHKVTHLFSSDVVHAYNDISARPPDWDRWHSTMTDQFSTLLNSFLARVLTTSTIPPHADVISTISLQNGGLGMQHPRLAAVPSFVFTTKRCILYAEQGIILPATTSSRTGETHPQRAPPSGSFSNMPQTLHASLATEPRSTTLTIPSQRRPC
jgi:hypothetical protein